MEAYRDQYAKLFHNGRKVEVIGISVDPDTAQASWARDEDFPVVFASDAGGKVGQMYGAYAEKIHQDNRSLFVVSPEGKITYVTKPFKVLSAASYKELGAAIDSVSPLPPATDSAKPPSGG